MSKLVDKIPSFLVPVVQTLIATGLTALLAWLYSQGLVNEIKKAQEELKVKVQQVNTCPCNK